MSIQTIEQQNLKRWLVEMYFADERFVWQRRLQNETLQAQAAAYQAEVDTREGVVTYETPAAAPKVDAEANQFEAMLDEMCKQLTANIFHARAVLFAAIEQAVDRGEMTQEAATVMREAVAEAQPQALMQRTHERYVQMTASQPSAPSFEGMDAQFVHDAQKLRKPQPSAPVIEQVRTAMRSVTYDTIAQSVTQRAQTTHSDVEKQQMISQIANFLRTDAGASYLVSVANSVPPALIDLLYGKNWHPAFVPTMGSIDKKPIYSPVYGIKSSVPSMTFHDDEEEGQSFGFNK